MIFHPDKRLLWHPRYDNKFVVGGGTQITLYECASEYPEIRHVTSQHDLTHMKCFAWSPDPAFDDLLAVGNRDGKVELIRLEAGKQSLRANALSSGSRVTLPSRTSRNVHALAFSDAEPSHLAVGTDKYRGESSIFIWNVNSLAPALQLSVSNYTDHDDGAAAARLETLPPRQRQTMFPRASETPPQRDSRIISQHCSAEVVTSLAFVPRSSQILAAALSFRWLRMLDLRAKPGGMLHQVATKAHTIAMDPFDEYRVACTADDTVNIWDRRKLTTPVLTFAERDALADGARFKAGTPITTLEFSSTRRGCLATLERDSSYVRFWDLTQCRAKVIEGMPTAGSSDAGDGKSTKDTSRTTLKKTGWGRGWLSTTDQPNPATQSPKEGGTTAQSEMISQAAFVISDTRRTKYFPRPLSSFALQPNRTGPSLTSNVMVVNKEGDLELYAIHDTKKQLTWSARGDLGIGAGLGMKILEGYREGETDDDSSFSQRHGSPHAHPHPHTQSQSHRGYNDDDEDDARDRRRPASRSRSRAASTARGRLSPSASLDAAERTPQPQAPFFGRGDEDGFPALPSQPQPQRLMVPTGLSATRPGKMRNYSPASVRKYRRSTERGGGEERSALLRRSLSRGVGARAAQPGGGGVGVGVGEDTAFSRRDDRRRSVDRDRHGGAGRALKKAQKKQGVEHVVHDDISMVMRRRAKAGYGLSIPRENIALTQGDDEEDVAAQMLSDLWSWIHMSYEVFCLPTPRIHGYDFSYHGLLGIWEGFPPSDDFSPTIAEDTPVAVERSLLLDPSASASVSGAHHAHARRSRSPADDLHGNWSAAITTLASRRDLDRWSWKSPVTTNKLLQRKLALLTCGWSLREDEISATITRFERDGEISKAACWLVFTGQANKAVELLMRSDDDTHQMMSGTVAALAPLAGRNLEMRGHFAHLILRLHDPYLRMMLAHLAMGDWAEVLEEEVIPFRERLIIAFQFLEDKALSSYLRRTVENAAQHGDIDGLVVSGLTRDGMRILQSYVDRTGDIQSAAILSSYVCPVKFRDKRADRWLDAYRDLLDGFKLHHLRVGFDIERGQIIQGGIHNGDMVPEEWAPRQVLIRCHYCNKPVRNPGMLMSMQQKGKPTTCENCNRELPRCSVCLITLSIVHDAAREVELGYTHHRDTFDDAIVICQTCRHGGHAVHILEWFLGEDTGRTHDVCPVADCNCRCADEF